MDDSDVCLSKGKTSVLSDPSVVARRKRMEIRRFKKLANSTQLLHRDDGDPLSLANTEFSPKRPRVGQDTMEFAEIPPDDIPKNNMHTEEHQFLPLSKGKEAAKIDRLFPPTSPPRSDIGLLRYKSLPAMNIHTNKEPPCRLNTDVVNVPVAESKGQSGCLLSRILKQQIDGPSSSGAACSITPPIALSSTVDVTNRGEIKNLEAELVKTSAATEQGLVQCQAALKNLEAPFCPTVGTSDAEMIDLFGQSSTISAHESVGLSTSQSTDAPSQPPSDCCFPPSGKLLVCGRRREMEDKATIAPSFTQLRRDASGSCVCNGKMEDRPMCSLHFFAVYDGHGGSQASNFCMENLHHVLAEELSSMSFAQEGNDEPSEGPSLSSSWERAMTSCFSKVDREVGGVCPNGLCDDVDSAAMCCSDSIAPENVGTTAVVAVVSVCQIVVANCGDSRAVLSRGGAAIPLSRDHKPDRDDEYTRIEAAGGRVIYWDGHRVGGLLALSRAIGDRYLKRYVVSTPEVTCLQRTKEDECLILASDGLWDVISNDTACEIARKGLDSSRKKRASGMFALGEDPACAVVAALLVKLAYGRGSKDNISVVVIDLKA